MTSRESLSEKACENGVSPRIKRGLPVSPRGRGSWHRLVRSGFSPLNPRCLHSDQVAEHLSTHRARALSWGRRFEDDSNRGPGDISVTGTEGEK